MKKLTEEDVKNRYITPAIEKAGWSKEQTWMEHYFTDGQVIVRGKIVRRGERKKADYLLSNGTTKDSAIAIVEAKKAECDVREGMQQAIDYAKSLNISFAYSSNGKGFVEHDRFTGKERHLTMEEFPSPEELINRYRFGEELTVEQEQILAKSFAFDLIRRKKARYYQSIAINRTVKAVMKGQKRILLVMATGTGKTFTAFQIINKLRENKIKKKILYLADRNILIDQTMEGDFKPFEKIITKVKNKQLNSAYEVYMSLYHQLAGDDGEEPYREFQPEFFDLIVVDECHRGSVREQSQWRRILEYFSSAVQIGMTATPKVDKEVSNIDYFGEPVYTYSLKEGIDDGFLAPYKVIRVGIDKDLEGWRPYKGQKDIYGEDIEDREYNNLDYDKKLILEQRTKLVAKRVTQWLKENGRLSKTIIFCVDIAHAARMREAMINENSDLVKENEKYIMQITGDNKIGKDQLSYFIDETSDYPTIVTTSKLLTTGVDCKTCKLIVLDSNINSLTEFKQIIGRGTRLSPEYGKEYFTIIDFRDASRLFADKEFDGDPVVIHEETFTKDGVKEISIEEKDTEDVNTRDADFFAENEADEFAFGEETDESKKKKKYYVNDVPVFIINERVQHYDKNGKLTTENIKDYSKKGILSEYASLEDFLQNWSSAARKQVIVEELESKGIILEALREETKNNDLDDFDLICHIAFDKKPLTKAERAKNVKKKGYLDKYSGIAREVLDALLDRYQDNGLIDLENTEILKTAPFDKMGSPMKLADLFGGKEEYLHVVQELTDEIYAN